MSYSATAVLHYTCIVIVTCTCATFLLLESLQHEYANNASTGINHRLHFVVAPRPNVFVYFTPLHVNVDQHSFLWLVQFVYGVVMTINMKLALSVHDEGKSYLVSSMFVK